jgi:hypothetical protein
VSRLLLDAGLRCMLFTDLANPTSNGVYTRIGYRRVGGRQRGALRADSTRMTVDASSEVPAPATSLLPPARRGHRPWHTSA